jgi:chaperonin GroES
MNVQPLRDFVVVTKDEAVKQSPGGLYVPATAEEKVVTGNVIAVGSGRVGLNGEAIPLEVKVGDKVAFNKNMATEVKVGHETALLLREDQLLCIVK